MTAASARASCAFASRLAQHEHESCACCCASKGGRDDDGNRRRALISAWTVRYRIAALCGGCYDPSIWLLVALILVAVATLGTLIPSLRAAIDPVRARGEVISPLLHRRLLL